MGIHLLTDQNPIQVVVAIINGGPREDSTRIGTAGVVRRQAVDVSPLRRVNFAIYCSPPVLVRLRSGPSRPLPSASPTRSSTPPRARPTATPSRRRTRSSVSPRPTVKKCADLSCLPIAEHGGESMTLMAMRIVEL